MDTATRRRTQNEAMSRLANEAIEEGTAADEGSPLPFLCECSRADCDLTIELTPREYRRVRADPRRFVVLRGHQNDDIEEIVGAQSDHLLVEKRGEAGALAEAEQP
jgi:hypothetical protein